MAYRIVKFYGNKYGVQRYHNFLWFKMVDGYVDIEDCTSIWYSDDNIERYCVGTFKDADICFLKKNGIHKPKAVKYG